MLPLVRFVVDPLCERPHLVPRDEPVAVQVQPPESRTQPELNPKKCVVGISVVAMTLSQESDICHV